MSAAGQQTPGDAPDGPARLTVQEKLAGLSFQVKQPCVGPKQVAVRVDITPRDVAPADHDNEVGSEEDGEREESQVELKLAGLPEVPCLLGATHPSLSTFELISELERLVATGWRVISSVYTYRSISNALPEASRDTSNVELFRRQLPVLEQEVVRLHDMHTFRDMAVATICQASRDIVSENDPQGVISGFGQAMGPLCSVIYQLFILDVLKASRPGLARDFDMYRRTLRVLQAQGDRDAGSLDAVANTALETFFAIGWNCLNTLAVALDGEHGGVTLAAALATYIYLASKESPMVMLPGDHFSQLGALAPLLFLLGGRAPFQEKGPAPPGVEALGKSRLTKCLRILKRNIVLPGMGDLVLQPGKVIALSPYLLAMTKESREGKLGKVPILVQMDSKAIAEMSQQRRIAPYGPKVMKEHFQVTSAVAALQFHNTTGRALPGGQSPMAEVRKAIAALSRWNILLAESHIWKCAMAQQLGGQSISQSGEGSAAPASAIPHTGSSASSQYSKEDLAALSEVVCCIKGLEGFLEQSAPWLQLMLDRAVYKSAQDFACNTMEHMIKPGSKTAVKDMLMHLRTSLAHWPGGAAPSGPAAKAKGFMHGLSKKLNVMRSIDLSKKAAMPPALPAPPAKPGAARAEDNHACPPSQAQAAVVQLLLEQLLAEGESAGKRSFLNSADLSAVSVKELSALQDSARHWRLMADIRLSAQQAADLSSLWLQEQRAQGRPPPLAAEEHGMTFALLTAALTRPGCGEAVLSSLHLLNDAGHRILVDLQVQHLYEELRLEATALLNELVAQSGDHLFSNSKATAARLQAHSSLLSSASGATTLFGSAAVPRRIEALLEQRHFHLLGRNVDLRALITTRVGDLLAANAAYLVSRFETMGIASVVELEAQVAVLRAAHECLAEQLALESWSVVWGRANASPLPDSFSKVADRAAKDLAGVVIPNYVMVAGMHKLLGPSYPRKAGPEPKPKAPPLPSFLLTRYGGPDSRSYKSFAAGHSTWLGVPHFQALLALLDTDGLAWLVDRVRDRVIHVVKYVLPAGLRTAAAAMSGLNVSMSPTNTGGGAVFAVFAFYKAQLEGVLGYQGLRKDLVGALAEIGNAYMLVRLADSALDGMGRREFMQMAPLLGIGPAGRSGLVRPGPTEDGEGPITPLDRLLSSAAEATGANPALAEFVTKHIQTQFWGRAIPHQHLQLWLLSMKDAVVEHAYDLHAAVAAEGASSSGATEEGGSTSYRAEKPQASGGVKFHNVLSALLFMHAGDSNTRAAPDSAASSKHPQLRGDGMHYGAAVLLCLLDQAGRWMLGDFSQVVVNSAEVEGLPKRRRSSSGGGDATNIGKQQAQELSTFVRNAILMTGLMQTAIDSVQIALPPVQPAPISFPTFESSGQSSEDKVWIEADPSPKMPKGITEPVPQALPGQKPTALLLEDPDTIGDTSFEAASPCGSIATVTTMQTSPRGSGLSSFPYAVPTQQDFNQASAVEDSGDPKAEEPANAQSPTIEGGEATAAGTPVTEGRRARPPPPPQNLRASSTGSKPSEE